MPDASRGDPRLLSAALRCALIAAALSACGTAPFRARIESPQLCEHPRRESPIDVEHYALELELEPASRSIRGACTVRFFPRAEALERFELDFSGLTVEGVTDARGRSLSFRHEDPELAIELAEPVHAGDSGEVTVRYSGAPKTGLWFVAERDGVPRQVFTQGECTDSRFWFPCIDEPSERATSELTVTLPSGWSAVAAGERVDVQQLEGGARRERWLASTPHPAYLTTLVAGELSEVRVDWDGTPLQFISAPEYAQWLAPTFAATPQVLEYFGELTGRRYPYPKYAQSCVAEFPFGGMENLSATTLTDTCLHDELGRRDYDATGLIAHEAAHQWFGDLLTCADWSHIWLNEGFATYGSLLYVEATRGTDEFRAGVRDMQDGYVASDVGAKRRPHVWNVYREPFDLFFGGQAYGGAACRLHLLRFVLGDEAFFRGIRRYVADNAGRAVVTDDLRVAMELESGMALAPFFRQWFGAPGYPEFEVRWSWDESNALVRVQVEQVQKALAGTPSVFVVPVDIEVRDESGSRCTRVTIDARHETFELTAASRPRWVAFDRYGWIPKRVVVQRSAEEWLALAADDDDVNGRREALKSLGHLLAESSDDDLRWRIATVILEGLGDPARSVRVTAARAFGRVFTPAANPIAQGLMRAASSDPEAAVRVAALETLAGWKENGEFASFGRAQFEQRFSWATMAAAARLVAAAEGEAALPWLEERLALDSPHDQLAAQVLPAFNALSGTQPIEVVRRCALDETLDDMARESAVRVLANLARYRTDVSRELSELLERTRAYRVQSALIDTLASFGDPRALSALEHHYAECFDSRHRRAVEEAIDKAGAQ